MPDQALSKVHQLAGIQFPAVRKTLQHFLQISQQNQVDLSELMASVELDPSLLAVFLSANSPQASLAAWHQDIDLKCYKQTALTLCNQFFSNQFNLEGSQNEQFYLVLWQRSLMQGAVCAALAEKIGVDATEHRLLGLCAGLGHHLLARTYGNDYINLTADISSREKLCQVELEHFGNSGDHVAARMLSSWGYDTSLSDALCYQYSSPDALQEASQRVQIVGFANCLLDLSGSSPNEAVMKAGKMIFNLESRDFFDVLSQAEASVNRSLTHLHELSEHDFQKELAQSNIAESVSNSLSNKSLSLVQLARLIFGIRHSIHFQLLGDQLVASPHEGDVLSLPLDSERSQIALCYKAGKSITAGREGLSSIVDKQLLQRLGTSACCLLPLGTGGVLACGLGQNQSIDESLMSRFQVAATQHLSQGKPHIELEYVHARVSEVTHEVNNPLAIVQNYLHTLSLKIDEDSPVQVDIKTISKEMLRVAGIVKKYGEIGLQEDLLKEDVNVNELLDQLCGVFRGGHESIKFNILLDAAMPLVSITPDSFKQVIVNLLKNAIEAIHPQSDGQIDISSHGSINLGGAQYIEILISDNGPGIPLEIRDKLFQAKNSSKGIGHSGLGLSIVKQLLSDMGGLISCRSQVKGEGSPGTTFQILIPLIV